MFCTKCGSQNMEGSLFCTSCGAKQVQDQNQSEFQNQFQNQKEAIQSKLKSVDTSILQVFIKDSIKNPISTCKNYLNKLSPNFVIIYFSISAVILSLINVFLSQKIFWNSLTKIGQLMSFLNGDSYDSYSDFLMEIEYYAQSLGGGAILSKLKNIILPFSGLILWFIMGTLALYLASAILMFLYHNLISKVQIPFHKYLVAPSVALTIQILGSLLMFVVSFVSLSFTMIILSITTIAIIVTLYDGFKELNTVSSSYPYVFSTIYILSTFISSYIVMKMISSHCLTLMTKLDTIIQSLGY